MRTHELDLLRAIVVDPSRIDDVRFIATHWDFLDPHLGQVYEALVSLHEGGRPVSDIRVVMPWLESMGLPVEELRRTIIDIFREWAAPHHARFFAEKVRADADRRRLKALVPEFNKLLDDPTTAPQDAMRIIDARLLSIRDSFGNGGNQVITLEEAAGIAVDAVTEEVRHNALPGTMTGLSGIDEKIGALRSGELIILAARPGVGKTALAMQIATHTARRQRPVFFASLEMSSRELAQRELCRLAEVDNRKLRRGAGDESDVAKLCEASTFVHGLPFHLWAPPAATLGQIRSLARIQNLATPLQLVVVDYLQLVRPDDRRLQRYEQVSQVSAGLKSLAKELSAPVLALCQLNREAEKSSPQLSHLRESGSIEQDADMVIFIDQDSKPEGDCWPVTIKVAKHRHGPTGKFTLYWEPKATAFSDGPPKHDLGWND